MQTDMLKKKLEGCYVTVPTPFRDAEGFPVDEDALRTYVRFLIDGGLRAENAVFLAGGAAGDFSTMTFDERIGVAEFVVAEVAGRVPVAMGAQTTSTLELVRLAKAARTHRCGLHPGVLPLLLHPHGGRFRRIRARRGQGSAQTSESSSTIRSGPPRTSPSRWWSAWPRSRTLSA